MSAHKPVYTKGTLDALVRDTLDEAAARPLPVEKVYGQEANNRIQVIAMAMQYADLCERQQEIIARQAIRLADSMPHMSPLGALVLVWSVGRRMNREGKATA